MEGKGTSVLAVALEEADGLAQEVAWEACELVTSETTGISGTIGSLKVVGGSWLALCIGDD